MKSFSITFNGNLFILIRYNNINAIWACFILLLDMVSFCQQILSYLSFKR